MVDYSMSLKIEKCAKKKLRFLNYLISPRFSLKILHEIIHEYTKFVLNLKMFTVEGMNNI